MSTFAPPRKTKSGTPNQSTVAGVFRRFRLSRQKIALCNQKTRSDRDWHSSLQHTQPWLPSSPLSLSSRPASPRPRRAPRAPSAPPPSTVSRSRSPRYARAVGPSVAEKHRFTARAIFFIFSSRIGARVAGHGRARGTKSSLRRARMARAVSLRGVPVRAILFRTSRDPRQARIRTGRVPASPLFPPTSPVAFVETQTSWLFFLTFCRTRKQREFVKSRRRRAPRDASRRRLTLTDCHD